MTESESTFRGYRQISEIADKVKELAHEFSLIRNARATIHLNPKDYYLVSRWPKAGMLCGFSYDGISEISIRWNSHPIAKAPGVYVVTKNKGKKKS